jgi:GDSL-like Lipase/Acylhydrolase family
MSYSQYLALGDSMSIDLYAALDAGLTDVSVALERIEASGNVAPVGAPSLFYKNDESLWPEEIGNDLLSRFPKMTYRRLAVDGATIGDVFGEQLPLVDESDEPTLVTLTIGTEDLFSAFSGAPKRTLLDQIVGDLIEAYDILIGAIQTTLPNSLIVATTVCDPSDRTGRIKGVLDDVSPLPIRGGLDRFNIHIREVVSGMRGVAFADPYVHFLGHGATAPEEDRWFWRRSPIELNSRGANELRKVWVETLRGVMGG